MTKVSIAERPIVVSGPEGALYAQGKKTQFRILAKERMGRSGRPKLHELGKDLGIGRGCSFSKAGSRFWVKEPFAPTLQSQLVPVEKASYVCFPDGSQMFKTCSRGESRYFGWEIDTHRPCNWPDNWKWSHPWQMPRWASRTTLKITDIRLQWLQEATNSDAVAEGFMGQQIYVGHGDSMEVEPLEQFIEAWDKKRKKGFRWADNPWVWVFDVQRLSETE